LFRPDAASSEFVTLRDLLEQWYRRDPARPTGEHTSEADRERLRALGYAN
jgi:hypothetical protein